MPILPTLSSGIKLLKFKPLNLFLLSSFAMTAMFSSCVKDTFSDIDVVYNGSVAFPVATVGFTLAEILEGDTLLTVDDDNSISLIYREDNFFTITAAELLEDVTGSIEESFSQATQVGETRIDDLTEEFQMPFSDLVDDFQDPVIAQMLEQNEGNTVPVPAFQENFTSEVSVPVFSDFSWLEIENGRMVLSVKNELFVDLQNFKISVFDNNSGQVIGSFDFANLPKGITQTEEISIAGKSIGNDFKVVVSSLQTPGTGSNAVLIDLSKKLRFTLEVKEITISAGEVKLPSGALADDQLQIQFNLENGEQLHQIALNDVEVTYNIHSEVKTDVKLKLSFPGIYKNNAPAVHEITVSPGGPHQGSLDFSNTVWYLNQDAGQPFNRMKVNYEVSLPNPTGNLIEFSAEDEVSIDFNISNLEVEEARGYFGFREEHFENGELDLGFDFSMFDPSSTPLLFEDPKMRIEVANSFGIPLKVEFNAEATGAYGAHASLQPPKLSVSYPGMNEIGSMKMSEFLISKNNSNIVEMLSVYPSGITYSGHATINPANDPGTMNFIQANSSLTASAELDLPFRFRVQDLIYRDTAAALELGLNDDLTVEDIESAEMKILYVNGMPLKSTVKIIALGSSGSESVVVEGVTVEPAAVNSAGKVTASGKAKGELFVEVTREQLRQLDSASKLIYEVSFQTGDNGQAPAAMFTDYDMELKIGMLVKFDK